VLLQEAATPFIDTPDDVIKRVLQLNRSKALAGEATTTHSAPGRNWVASPKQEYQRSGRGKKTHQSEYRLPILHALDELGGRGALNDVLAKVYAQMEDRLNEYDLARLDSDRDIRWRNTAMWERKRMVEEGLLRADSPVGIWELTEAGRKKLGK